MASCICHVLCVTKRLRLERIVRPRQLRFICHFLKVVRCQKRYASLAGSVERNAPGEAAPSGAPSHMRCQQPQLIEEALDTLVCVLGRVTNPEASVWTCRIP
jgi:hypothetical protein